MAAQGHRWNRRSLDDKNEDQCQCQGRSRGAAPPKPGGSQKCIRGDPCDLGSDAKNKGSPPEMAPRNQILATPLVNVHTKYAYVAERLLQKAHSAEADQSPDAVEPSNPAVYTDTIVPAQID